MTSLLSEPIRARSLVDAIVQRLEAAIMSGELGPGSRVREQTLARALGVSRGPLREAIRRLEGRKLIQRTPNRGPQVASLSQRDLVEILVVREALEGIACRIAAEVMTDKEIAELTAVLDRHGQSAELRRGTAYYQEARDFDFHYRIVKGSRITRLVELLCGDLYDLLRVYRYHASAVRGRARQAYAEHRGILAAIAARDPERAEALMREHIRHARENVEKGFESRTAARGEGDRRGPVRVKGEEDGIPGEGV